MDSSDENAGQMILLVAAHGQTGGRESVRVSEVRTKL